MQYFTNTIPAGGSVVIQWAGVYLSVKQCTQTLNVAFDGGPQKPVAAGAVLDNDGKKFRFCIFSNPNTVAVSVNFFIGLTPVNYAPADNATQSDKTFLFCNGGTPTTPFVNPAKTTGGANWSVTSGQPVNVLTSGAIYIPGKNNGFSRKQITFECTTLNGNSSDVIILDVNGLPFLRAKANDTPYTFETSADFYVCGYGGGVAQGAFLFSEIYYTAG